MKVPNHHLGVIDENKITKYLFSLNHPVGKAKANYFLRIGFDLSDNNYFAELLLTLVKNNEISALIETPFGTKFIVDGFVRSPSGIEILLTTIWFIEKSETIPYFVTAYPTKIK